MLKSRDLKYLMNDEQIAVTHFPGYKKPVLCRITQNGCVYQKLATFLSEESAETFNKSMFKMLGIKEEPE